MGVQLKAILSKPLSKVQLMNFILAQKPDISELISLSLVKNKEVAFRASWMLENAVENSPEDFENNILQFVQGYCKLENYSCLRSFSKICIEFHDEILSSSASNLDGIIERSFECVIDPDCPVAVKANCLDVLFHFRFHNSWLAEELKAQLIYLLSCESPALLSRSKSLLSRLK